MRCHVTVRAIVILTVGVGLFTQIAVGAEPKPNVREVVRKYTPEIVALVDRQDHRGAIAKAADYELALLNNYPAPSYEMGLFRSEAVNASFRCPFVEWKQVDMDKEPELKDLKKLAIVGWDVLLVLEGDAEEERLMAACIDTKQLTQGVGAQDDFPDMCSGQGLQLVAQMIAGKFGAVKSQPFQDVGAHKVLFLEIKGPMMAPDVRMALLPNAPQIFAFFLISPNRTIVANERRLDELMKTASFDYQPQDAQAIAAARSKGDRKEIRDLLSCVSRLAELGEYRAAGADLAEVRLLLHERMPAPVVKNNVGTCPAYGITLTNPDPDEWKLSVNRDGVFQGLFLEDRFSVHGEGIMVGAIDFLTSYGPEFIKMMNDDEEMSKQMLIDSGRGGAAMLGEIESERLVQIQGSMAYEAMISPNMPGVKARTRAIGRDGTRAKGLRWGLFPHGQGSRLRVQPGRAERREGCPGLFERRQRPVGYRCRAKGKGPRARQGLAGSGHQGKRKRLGRRGKSREVRLATSGAS